VAGSRRELDRAKKHYSFAYESRSSKAGDCSGNEEEQYFIKAKEVQNGYQYAKYEHKAILQNRLAKTIHGRSDDSNDGGTDPEDQ